MDDPRNLPPWDPTDDSPAFLKDQRDAYRALASQVVWHSAPLAEETIVTGRPRLTLQVAIDQPDADLFAVISEVLPTGEASFLSSTQVRLRYREGGTVAVAMVPDFFARALAKGSRIRLEVRTGPSRWLQRNTNTGGDLASEPPSASRIARVTVMTGPGAGSRLELPQPTPEVLRRNDDALRPPALHP